MNKRDAITIQSHGWLLQLLQPVHSEWLCYPGIREQLLYTSLSVSTWLLPSVVFLLIYRTVYKYFPHFSRYSVMITLSELLKHTIHHVSNRDFPLELFGVENQEFEFRLNLVNPGFMFSYLSEVEFLRIRLKVCQKISGNFNSFQLVLRCQHFWDSFCWQHANLKDQIKQCSPNQEKCLWTFLSVARWNVCYLKG